MDPVVEATKALIPMTSRLLQLVNQNGEYFGDKALELDKRMVVFRHTLPQRVLVQV